jgi:hypothetical protein
VTHVCRQIEVDRYNSIPEVMIKWEGFPTPAPISYFRTSSMVTYAEVCGPDDLLNNSWHDIVNCALTAATATLATIPTTDGSPDALATFQAAFTPCATAKMGARAGEIQVALSTQQKPNEDWHR